MSAASLIAEAAIDSGVPTPIAQLRPDLPEEASRTVHGEVTVIWPYNSVQQSLAFLLAEPDVRLRRAKGQVRVQLRGASAKAVAELDLGGGDEVMVVLDGVKWIIDDTTPQLRAARLEWQLTFSDKLLLRAKLGELSETRVVIVDPATSQHTEHPPQALVPEIDVPVTPAPIAALASATPLPQSAPDLSQTNEFASPAFIKRARLSYGSFFEGGFDIFEDDGGVKGKGRKRTRFGRDSNAWRYSSQSLSPEPEPRENGAREHTDDEQTAASSPSKPQMLDEGSQTVDIDMSVPMRNSLGLSSQDHLSAHETTPVPRTPEHNYRSPLPAVQEATRRDHVTDPMPRGVSSEDAMFGTLTRAQNAYSIPRPQQASEGPANPGIGLMDNVRFAFHSHQDSRQPDVGRPSEIRTEDAQPHTEDNHVDARETETGAKTPFGQSTVTSSTIGDVLRRSEVEHSIHDTMQNGVPREVLWTENQPSPPLAAEARSDIEDDIMQSQSGDDEEEPVDPVDSHPDEIPLGFHSYGTEEMPVADVESEEDESVEAPEAAEDADDGREFIQNDELVDDLDHDVAVEHDDDEAEYEDEDGGDYDQRNYLDEQDDEEGYSDEEDGESEDEGAGVREGINRHHVDPELLFDDGEESLEEGDEDMSEEDYESDEEILSQQPVQDTNRNTRNAAPIRNAQPEVIDLISDSEEEEDEEVPVPNQERHPNQMAAPGEGATKSPIVPATRQEEAPHTEQAVEPVSEIIVPATQTGEEDEGGVGDKDAEEVESVDAEGEMDFLHEEPTYERDGFPADTAIGGQNRLDELVQEQVLQGSDDQDFGRIPDTGGPGQPLSSPIHQMDVVAAPESHLTDTVILQYEGVAESRGSEPPQLQTGTTPVEPPLTELTRLEPGFAIAEATVSLEVEEEDQPIVADFAQADQARITSSQEETLHPTEPPISEIPETATQPVTLTSPLQSSETPLGDPTPVLPPAHESTDGVFLPPPAAQVEYPVIPIASSPPHLPSASQATTHVDENRQLPSPLESQTVLGSFGEPSFVGEKSASKAPTDEVLSAKVPITHDSAVDQPVEVTQDDAPEAIDVLMDETTPILGQERDYEGEGDRADASPSPKEVDAAAEEAEQSPAPDTVHDSSQLLPPTGTPPTLEEQAHRFEDIMNAKARDSSAQEQPTPPVSPPSRKAKPAPLDPSIQFARAAVASKRAKGEQPRPPRESPRHARTRSMSFRKSATPETHDTSVQLARAALKSPSKVAADGETDNAAAANTLKTELNKRLRGDLPDCIPLKSLRSHIGKHLDVVGIATTQPPVPERAKGGPRQYVMSFNLTDPSLAPLSVVEVQFFRAHKDTLPTVKPGDGVLLRDFQVVALPKKGFGLRTHDSSSWAVFDQDDGSYQVKGPPVEVDETESDYVARLRTWYGLLDHAARNKLDKANQKFAEINRAT